MLFITSKFKNHKYLKIKNLQMLWNLMSYVISVKKRKINSGFGRL